MIKPLPKGAAARGLHPRPRGRPPGSRDRAGRAIILTAGSLKAHQIRIATGIAERLSRIMEERDVSVSEISEAVGVSKNAVFAQLAGHSTPGLWTLIAYAAALRCSLVDLLPDEAHLP